MSTYICKNHRKYFLKIHLIFCVKYRKKLLVNTLDEDMKQIMYDISQESDFKIDIMETDKDHIHFLLSITPNYSITSIVRRMKQISTNRIWKLHRKILFTQFWKENTFWSDGYFVCSIGNANPETIKKYIEEQG